MTERQKDIADMQCWVFRMAQSKWEMTAKDCAELFKKYDLLGFVSECYDLLHVSSYNNALEDIEDILRANGVNVCKKATDGCRTCWMPSPERSPGSTVLRDREESKSHP